MVQVGAAAGNGDPVPAVDLICCAWVLGCLQLLLDGGCGGVRAGALACAMRGRSPYAVGGRGPCAMGGRMPVGVLGACPCAVLFGRKPCVTAYGDLAMCVPWGCVRRGVPIRGRCCAVLQAFAVAFAVFGQLGLG